MRVAKSDASCAVVLRFVFLSFDEGVPVPVCEREEEVGWREPKNCSARNKGKWESKVNWAILTEVDIANRTPGLEIPKVESALRKRFRDKALVARNLPTDMPDPTI